MGRPAVRPGGKCGRAGGSFRAQDDGLPAEFGGERGILPTEDQYPADRFHVRPAVNDSLSQPGGFKTNATTSGWLSRVFPGSGIVAGRPHRPTSPLIEAREIAGNEMVSPRQFISDHQADATRASWGTKIRVSRPPSRVHYIATFSYSVFRSEIAANILMEFSAVDIDPPMTSQLGRGKERVEGGAEPVLDWSIDGHVHVRVPVRVFDRSEFPCSAIMR